MENQTANGTIAAQAQEQGQVILSAASAWVKGLTWADARTLGKNIVIAIATAAYLAFLFAKGCVWAGQQLRKLWKRYECTAKVVAAYHATKTHLDSQVALEVRHEQVTDVVEDAATWVEGNVSQIAQATARQYAEFTALASK